MNTEHECGEEEEVPDLVRLSNCGYVIETSDALGATLTVCLYHFRTNASSHLNVHAQSISQVYTVNFEIKVCLDNVSFRAYLGYYE
jgi:hypothetical protein